MNISFKEYRKKDDIHGTVLYPATMIAPVQKKVLVEIAKDCNIQSVLDPFHGSGTALYEALEVFPNARLTGCDINPLANLITEVKLSGVDVNIRSDIEQLKRYIKEDPGEPVYTFRNSAKWFRSDIAKDLTRIRNSIMRIESEKNRKYFWCMLSDIIRRYSNTRSSTYKLHIKPEYKIKTMVNELVVDFIATVNNEVDKYTEVCDNFSLHKADAIETLQKFEDASFDVCITSPPYGDNDTTVPYGQFSMPILYWIDSNDIVLEGWELDSYYAIDNKSLGGYKERQSLTEYQLKLISYYLSRISESKRKKVIRFFSDYFLLLDQICRVTNQYVVMTLGNRRVDNVKINLTRITMKYLEGKGFIKEQKLTRNILYKRTPSVTSKVDEKPVSSMNKEYVIIYKRDQFALAQVADK